MYYQHYRSIFYFSINCGCEVTPTFFIKKFLSVLEKKGVSCSAYDWHVCYGKIAIRCHGYKPKCSLFSIFPISFYHYLLTYQEGEEGGGSQVGACTG